VTSVPERPASVPARAVFVETTGEWIVGPFDEKGSCLGEHRSYRADGSIAVACRYEHGVLDGPYRRFHPNGELARECSYKEGKLEGEVQAFGSRGPTTESLRSCCVPPGAFRLEARYENGSRVFERFFDEEGRRLLPDGAPFPEKPSHLPDEAELDEWARRWYTVVQSSDEERRSLRFWSSDGVLCEERQTWAGKLHGVVRTYDVKGALAEEAHYENDVRRGPYRRVKPAPGVYADRRIREERGSFGGELAVGVWEYFDESGEVVRTADLGVAELDAATSPAFHPKSASPERWRQIACDLTAAHRTGEALLALARASASSSDGDGLRRAMDELRPPLNEREATAVALRAIEKADGKLDLLLNALVRGGEPAAMLRIIGASCPKATRASLDFVNAAILLAPAWDQCKVTRALVRLSLGDPEGARLDGEALGDAYAEQRKFLHDYRRILFPKFDFWPAHARFDSLVADLPEEPCQPLQRIRATIQKCATRLTLMRGAIVELLGSEPSWHMPDVSALLPNGPVPLERRMFQVVLDDEDPPQVALAAGSAEATESVEQVLLDETLALSGREVASLMRLVRADWTSLTWLCWSAGLDRVGLPDRLAPPPNFSQAIGMAIERQWRALDKLTSGGLIALTKGVRPFEWEGLDIDFVPPALAEIIAHEYTDLRAVFFFLCDDRQESPWQDNLRRS
jgi:antitoxin component YwqK of YwqJK toxin-antitoxin module